MRTKQEILDQLVQAKDTDIAVNVLDLACKQLMLEVLVDIRDRLEEIARILAAR